MRRDIRELSRSDLDALNVEIARYKAERSGMRQSDISTQAAQLDDAEKASIPVEGNADGNRVPITAEQGTINAEQLDLF
jgi:hypothetical protein